MHPRMTVTITQSFTEARKAFFGNFVNICVFSMTLCVPVKLHKPTSHYA
jgi:hypothetical protein